MPYNGAGIFQLVAGNPVVTGTLISSTWANNTLADLVNNGLSNCITKDGQTTPTANIPFNGVRITGIGDAVNPQDGVSFRQLTAYQSALSAVQTVSASVSGNALTATFTSNGPIQFRNPTLSNGTPVVVQTTPTLSITVPSGATLGTTSAVASTLVLLVAYNGGTPVLCIANLAGGVSLDETGVISPATISGTSNTGAIFSASTVSAGSPYRVVGVVQITEATAGTWATGPTTVQGVGGEAFSTMQSFGVGQTVQNVVGSRGPATTYYNTTNRTIWVEILMSSASVVNSRLQVAINGVVCGYGDGAASVGGAFGIKFPVPVGVGYSVTFQAGSGALGSWFEIR